MKTQSKACLLAGTFFSLTLSFSPAHAQSHSEHMPSYHEHTTTGTPLFIMGDHTHNQGDWMVSYRFKRMHMEGNRQGDSKISPDEIVSTLSNPNAPPANVRVVPTEMDMDMHMFNAMYGLNDRLTLMAMAMYMQNDMTHITYAGMMGTTQLGEFTTRASGWGDTQLSAVYKLFETSGHKLNVNLGLSIPTGSIKEEDDVLTPMNMRVRLRLPYAMQLGSGTWDLLPGVTYSGHQDKWFWGAQYEAEIRMEDENNQGYRLGDKHRLSAWSGYQFTPEFAANIHMDVETQGKIHGADENITAPVQTANPDNYGGDIVEIGTGFTYQPTHPAFKGGILGVDFTLPAYQNLNGVQLERDWSVNAGLRYKF